MKVQMSISDELVKKIDSFCTDNYLTRSGFVSMACAQYLASYELTLVIKEMALCLRKIADTGVVDPDTLRDLEDFERIAKMLVSAK